MFMRSVLIGLVAVLVLPSAALSDGEVIEFSCASCGYKQRFAQGWDAQDQTRNIQSIIVVCERSREIRSIKIPLDPQVPVTGEPLMGRQYGTGRSEVLGVRLPRFLVPGNTCPLFPITAYLEHNICPVDGKPGIRYTVVGYF
jgi:hypothetical protein